MKSTEQTTVRYKTLLLESLELQGKSGEAAHRRATILCEVFMDRDWRLDNGSVDDWQLAEVLDTHCEDLCLTFWELRELFVARPNVDDWKSGQLRTMYRQVADEIAEKQREARLQAISVKAHQRKAPTHAQDVTDDRDEMTRLIQGDQTAEPDRPIISGGTKFDPPTQVVSLQQQLADARAECDRLKAENARLKATIADLRKTLEREPAMAGD